MINAIAINGNNFFFFRLQIVKMLATFGKIGQGSFFNQNLKTYISVSCWQILKK